MKQLKFFTSVLALLICAGVPLTSQAVDFRFPVGLSYVNGAFDLNDKLKESYEQRGYLVEDDFIVPVGLVFSPYMELENGLGFGLSLGPTTFVAVERDTYYGWGGYDEEVELNYIIPIGADVRYAFLRDRDISPYVRAGVRYPITGGDDLDSSTPGAYGGAGIEFWRSKRVSLAVEVGYDSSEVKLKTGQKVTPQGFLVSVSAVF